MEIFIFLTINAMIIAYFANEIFSLGMALNFAFLVIFFFLENIYVLMFFNYSKDVGKLKKIIIQFWKIYHELNEKYVIVFRKTKTSITKSLF